MNQLALHAQQLSELLRQHVPAEAMAASLPTAVAALLIGVGVCVLGAKLARWFTSVVFVVGGIAAGLATGAEVGFAPLPSAVIGGVLLGALGYGVHRLWVGMFAGLFLATVAMGGLASQLILPHQAEFEAARPAPVVTEFRTGPADAGDSVEAAVAAGWDQCTEYLMSVLRYAMDREPHLRRFGVLWVIGAAALGLLMGIFLYRLTLILFTAAFGVSLIGTGIAMLGPHLGLDVYEICQQRPQMSAAALASCFVLSIILQTLLTRPERAPAPVKAKSAE